jgi:hypothetical protein
MAAENGSEAGPGFDEITQVKGRPSVIINVSSGLASGADSQESFRAAFRHQWSASV